MTMVYVQRIEFELLSLFGNVYVKSLLTSEPSRATALIPVRLANGSFEDKIILFLSLDGFLKNRNR
jgi:hypothetical protein